LLGVWDARSDRSATAFVPEEPKSQFSGAFESIFWTFAVGALPLGSLENSTMRKRQVD
jgi:hypothetical protein